MSTVPLPGTQAGVPIPPHRLTSAQAEEIAAGIPWKKDDLPPWLRTLYVRAVDAGRPWVETYLTTAEQTAIRVGIDGVAPRTVAEISEPPEGLTARGKE